MRCGWKSPAVACPPATLTNGALPMSDLPTLWDSASATSSPESAGPDSPADSPAGPTNSNSGRVGSLAKISALPAKALGLKARAADSGGSGSALSTPADPLGCSLRMSLLCELAGLTPYSLHWKESATPAGRSWWVLIMSARRTDDTGFGLWPTATASANANRNTKSCPSHGNGHGFTLAGVVHDQNWPTARAEDSEQTGAHNGTPDTLTSAARQDWFTPQSRDWKDTGPTQGNRKDVNLGVQAHQWNTPTAGTADAGCRSRSGKRKGELLLADQAAQDSPSTVGKVPACLNSEWVGSLQGFPPRWGDELTETSHPIH